MFRKIEIKTGLIPRMTGTQIGKANQKQMKTREATMSRIKLERLGERNLLFWQVLCWRSNTRSSF